MLAGTKKAVVAASWLDKARAIYFPTAVAVGAVIKHEFTSGGVVFHAGIGSGKFRQRRWYAMIR